MTKRRVSGVILFTIAVGVWVAGYFDGVQLYWWEPVIWFEGVTFALFKTFEL